MRQSESRSNQPTSRQSLIDDWLTRLAVNSGVPLEPGTRAVYIKLWTESLADLDDAKLNAAFQKTLLTWVSEFGKAGKLPTVGDIRGHLDATAKKELASRADLEWQKLLDYIRRYYWADGPWEHKAPKLPERVRVSANAAGGLAYLNECDRESLQWAKKRFVESYTAWEEMKKDQWLLPEGTLRNILLEEASEKALLPGPAASAEDWLPPVKLSNIAPKYTPRVSTGGMYFDEEGKLTQNPVTRQVVASGCVPSDGKRDGESRAEFEKRIFSEKETDPRVVEEIRRQKAALSEKYLAQEICVGGSK
jgi:hypothetical protein